MKTRVLLARAAAICHHSIRRATPRGVHRLRPRNKITWTTGSSHSRPPLRLLVLKSWPTTRTVRTPLRFVALPTRRIPVPVAPLRRLPRRSAWTQVCRQRRRLDAHSQVRPPVRRCSASRRRSGRQRRLQL